MPGNFRPNHAGIQEILNGEGVRRVLREVAEKGKAYAESIAPFDPTPDDQGHYKDSFDVVDETIEWRGDHPGPRAAVRLANHSPHAAAVEYGFAGRSGEPSVSAHRVLGRTLDYLEAEGKA